MTDDARDAGRKPVTRAMIAQEHEPLVSVPAELWVHVKGIVHAAEGYIDAWAATQIKPSSELAKAHDERASRLATKLREARYSLDLDDLPEGDDGN